MRAPDWIHIVVFSLLVALAWLVGLPGRRRAKAAGGGVVGLGREPCRRLPVVPLRAAFVMRDWLPAALMLLVYWQTRESFVRNDQRFQGWLERVDRRIGDTAARLALALQRSGVGRSVCRRCRHACSPSRG